MRTYKPKKRKKKTFPKKEIFLITFLFLIMLFLVWFIFFSSVFKIKTFSVKGDSLPKDCSANVNAIIGNELGQNIFLFKSNNIRQNILKNCFALKNLSIKKEFPDKLLLLLKTRKAVAKACSLDNCFFIDSSGIAFKTSLKDNSLPLISLLKRSIVIGDQVLLRPELTKILEITNWFKRNLDVKIERFILNKNEKLIIKTEENWEAYFDLSLELKDIKFSLFKLQAFLEKGISLEERKNLKYIDLRFSKVYYK